MYGFIYCTRNLINNKKYIGQHKYCGKIDKYYLGSGIALNNSIKKYGRKNFKREIICECETLEELNNKEIYYINLLDAVNSKEFYNLALGGNGGEGNHWWENSSEEARNKANLIRSQKMKGENNPFYGKKHSRETRDKLSFNASQRIGKKNPFYGKHITDEHKLKMNNALGDISGKNNPFYGKKHTEKTRKIMRDFANKKFANPNYLHPNSKPIILEFLDSKQQILFVDSRHCFKYLENNKLNTKNNNNNIYTFSFNTFRSFIQNKKIFNNIIAYRK
jgi:group I intron endonuclease